MDTTTIQEAKNAHILRTTRKLMEKLFQLHKDGKLATGEYVQKLERLKAVVKTNLEEVKRNEEIIRSRRRAGGTLLAFMVEHLNHVGCFETAELLCSRHGLEEQSDGEFYRTLRGMQGEVRNGEFDSALAFCKEYRIELRGSKFKMSPELENNLKIEKFIGLCHSQRHEEAVEFVDKEFKKIPESIKPYLPILVNSGTVTTGPEQMHTEAGEMFLEHALALFRRPMKSRLTKRIEYAMMAYKTYHCDSSSSERCPACCKAFKLREDVPSNKHEISILLCKATQEEMDDTNPPYAFEDGSVYGARYIETVENICVTSRTPENACRYPKLCFIV
jgi:macrophage erythroblast attacher